MAGVASVGASAIYVCIGVGVVFMLWLCNYVFKPYIVKCFSKIYRTRVAMELDLLDTQKEVLIMRLKRPPTIKRNPKTGSIIYEFWTPAKKITTENDEPQGRMRLADVVDLEFHKNELEKQLIEERFKEDLEKKRKEKEEKEKLRYQQEDDKIKSHGSLSGRRVKQRPPIPPNKLKRLRKMIEEERIREELLKILNHVPTLQERIERGKKNFKKHFLYHGKFIGWQLTTKQYNSIDKTQRENLYLQKHLGPFFHKLTTQNISSKDPLLPKWDDKTVVSERSSKKLKIGVRYRPKVIRDYYTRLPPSEIQIIRSKSLTHEAEETEKLKNDLLDSLKNEIQNGTTIDGQIDYDGSILEGGDNNVYNADETSEHLENDKQTSQTKDNILTINFENLPV